VTVAASTFEWVQVVGGTVAALAALATIAGKNSDPETASTLSRSETCSTLRAVADDTHATPEEAAEAAFSDIPSKYVRVESVSYSDDDTAVVTLLMNEEPYLYPYYVHCVRDDSGRWSETFSSN
jgi:hypothetical protein